MANFNQKLSFFISSRASDCHSFGFEITIFDNGEARPGGGGALFLFFTKFLSYFLSI